MSFWNLYKSLTSTLAETFPEFPELGKRLEFVLGASPSEQVDILNAWQTIIAEDGKVLDLIGREDAELFISHVQPLADMHLPKLWVKGALSDTSKSYVWSYLKALTKILTDKKKNALVATAKDIAPMDIFSMFGGGGGAGAGPDMNAILAGFMGNAGQPGVNPMDILSQVYKALPPQFISRMQQTAAKYTENPQNLDFGALTTDIMSAIDPKEIASIAETISKSDLFPNAKK